MASFRSVDSSLQGGIIADFGELTVLSTVSAPSVLQYIAQRLPQYLVFVTDACTSCAGPSSGPKCEMYADFWNQQNCGEKTWGSGGLPPAGVQRAVPLEEELKGALPPFHKKDHVFVLQNAQKTTFSYSLPLYAHFWPPLYLVYNFFACYGKYTFLAL